MQMTMRLPGPADDYLQPTIDYHKYARMFARDDFTYEEKIEAVKMIEIMVLEALEHHYPDETFERYSLRARAGESQDDSAARHSRKKSA